MKLPHYPEQRLIHQPHRVVGIDVGGPRKGYHAVALDHGRYLDRKDTKDVEKLVEWCRTVAQAMVVAVDAPCRWSTDGRARPAERQLMQKGVWCFSTPTRKAAHEHTGKYYHWMLRGEELFQALETTHPLCLAVPTPGKPCCFETYPHAITWHLLGNTASARLKRAQRRHLLDQHGIILTGRTSIDHVDAALCALTAHMASSGRECRSYGAPETGLIIVPTGTTAAPA